MSDEIGPAPVRGREGCLGKACATLAGLLVFLAIALVAGTFWGLHFIRGYSATEPLLLSPVETPAALPTPVPTPETTSPTVPMARDWDSFREAAQRGEAVTIALTADDINRLIAAEPEARGKVLVAIADNVGNVRISLPLTNVPFMKGRYLNGELDLESAPDGDPAKVRVSNIRLNDQPVAIDFLDRSLFGYPPLRNAVEKWVEDQRLATFRIENGRAIGVSRGSR